jgi:hypothetical protein
LDALFVGDSVAIISTTERPGRNYENHAYPLADNPNLAFLTSLSFAPAYSVAGDKKPTQSKKEVQGFVENRKRASRAPENR